MSRIVTLLLLVFMLAGLTACGEPDAGEDGQGGGIAGSGDPGGSGGTGATGGEAGVAGQGGAVGEGGVAGSGDGGFGGEGGEGGEGGQGGSGGGVPPIRDRSVLRLTSEGGAVPLEGTMELEVSIFRGGTIDQEDARIHIDGLPVGITAVQAEVVVGPSTTDASFTLKADRSIAALDTAFPISVTATSGSYIDTVELEVSVEAIVRSAANRGPGTLRHMIEAALEVGGAPTIRFAESILPATISLDSPLIVDHGSLTIWGSMSQGITLDGGGAVRIIEIGPAANLSLVMLNLQNGYSNESGGCISSEGDLTLASVLVSNCLAAYNGGGLDSPSGKSVRLQDTVFEFCGAEDSGGGAFVTGPLEAHRSRFDWNSAGMGGGLFLSSSAQDAVPVDATHLSFSGNFGGGLSSIGGHHGRVHAGGAVGSIGPTSTGLLLIGPGPWTFESFDSINNEGPGMTLSATTVTCKGCRIEHNEGYGQGGGISADASVLTLISSSVFGNRAQSGGGVWIGKSSWSDLPSRLTVINTMIAANELFEASRDSQGAGIHAQNSDVDIWFSTLSLNDAKEGLGGGINSNRPVRLFGTIVAKNRARDATVAQDWNGSLDSLGYNWIGVADGLGGLQPTDRYGTGQAPHDPFLQQPGVYNGFMTSMPPLWGSPVIDAIPRALCKANGTSLTEDQVGTTRPVGAGCEIGSIERN